MQKILILGLGKSGTTALHYHLLKAVDNSIGLLEPNTFDEVQNFYAENEDKTIVVKVLLDRYTDDLIQLSEYFDKVIFITRDVRDILISVLLYVSAGIFVTKRVSDDRVIEAVSLIRIKAASPGDLSVHQILESEAFFEVNQFIKQRVKEISESAMALGQLISQLFVLRYEDFLGRKVKGLANYLGVAIEALKRKDIEMPKVQRSIIVRAKGADNWRNWFTPQDIEVYKPLLSPILEIFSYDPENWDCTVSNKPIPPEISSEYFLKMVNYRRKEFGYKVLDI
ncbi:MAG: hypothetical protein L0958_05445 [Candidatus Mariimomonas ferrooxydans]